MKKIFTTLFILSLIVSPSVSNAGFFDFFRINQTAQIKNVSTINSNIVGYRKGDRAEVITQVQKALFDKGLYKGDISGLIGPKTEASIRAWQQANRLPVTGILDAETINSILGRSGDDNRGGGNPNSTTAQANCAPGDMPWIKVKKPNGGETYVAGENVKVRWESCNVSSTSLVYINIETSNVGQSLSTPVISGTVNDGIEQITIPTGFTPGPYYVQVYTPAPDYNADFSDNSFTIGNQLGGGNSNGICNMEVLYPYEGAEFQAGQSMNALIRIYDVLPGETNCLWGVFEGQAGTIGFEPSIGTFYGAPFLPINADWGGDLVDPNQDAYFTASISLPTNLTPGLGTLTFGDETAMDGEISDMFEISVSIVP